MSDELCSGCLKPYSKSKMWDFADPLVKDGKGYHYAPPTDDSLHKIEFEIRVANNECVCGL